MKEKKNLLGRDVEIFEMNSISGQRGFPKPKQKAPLSYLSRGKKGLVFIKRKKKEPGFRRGFQHGTIGFVITVFRHFYQLKKHRCKHYFLIMQVLGKPSGTQTKYTPRRTPKNQKTRKNKMKKKKERELSSNRHKAWFYNVRSLSKIICRSLLSLYI